MKTDPVPVPPAPVILLATGGLGDTILFSPVLRAAARAFPEHPRYLIAASTLVADVYGRTPELVKVMLINTNRLYAPATWRMFMKLYGITKRTGGSALLACASRISQRQINWIKTLCNPAQILAAQKSSSDLDDLTINQFSAKCIQPDAEVQPPFIPLTQADFNGTTSVIKHFFNPYDLHNCVVVYPSTPRVNRPLWPLPMLAECARHLAKQLNGPVVVVGGRTERMLWEQACGVRPNIINLAGHLSLRQSIALFAHVRLALCNDGGMMHAAGAMNCPLVAIMPSAPTHYRPPGQFTRIVSPLNLPCHPCYPGKPVCDHHQAIRPCTSAITQADVLQAAESAINDSSNYPRLAPLFA